MLASAGIQQLRERGDEIHGSCPAHLRRVGKIDHHPSWSINTVKLTHMCFSCHYSGTLSSLLTDLTGQPPSDELEQELRSQSFIRRMAEVNAEEVLEQAPPLTEWALTHHLGDIPNRLLMLRNLQRTAIDFYEVRWDSERRAWVLPIRSASGDLLGAQYRQKGSVYTDPQGMKKSETFFGFSIMSDGDYVTLVESPLDAIRLYGLGIPAVASLGSWISEAQARLLARNFSRVYLALDNDRAGIDGSTSLIPKLKARGTAPVMWRYSGKAKDIGDVETDAEVLAMWNSTITFGL